ncbi:hypothetical protein ACWT_5670 [Actinoplanes sp. SE50]|uniref:hypothetical protein n=1 Tax=unclassified Actinoplanes TaxID=2626549 RepID=UPI00023ED2C5|nr:MULTISPECIES: hypothetical protein [unclassified Actinoplanes]AEV86687.1 hypothetical protein ACPL_5800 [Actinoplanes sp. SE50/110]ATO85085.1 hypothetical protein ACWT_5670 [Actinoplanes sp. SE50]SLM02496.1 PadR-like family transcriptional regulator [Actinoplanes sp. SE50/110]
MIGWWKRRREQQRRYDEQRVLQAIRMLRPSQAGGYPIGRLAHISQPRVHAALDRLQAAGVVASEWEPGPVSEFRPRRRLYRIAGSRLVEVGR